MAAVTTERLLRIALELAGWDEEPADCVVAAPGTRISHVLLGVEAGAAELFMARQLGYHAVAVHDPTGTSAALTHGWRTEGDLLAANGVPPDTVGALIDALSESQTLEGMASNYDHAASVARLLEMPLVVVGSALAEVTRRTLQGVVDELAVRMPLASVADLREALMAVPEYAAARTVITRVLGELDAPAGRTVVLGDATRRMRADVVRAYLTHGVDTLCCPALAPADAAGLAEAGVRGNVLALGRIATASIGLNAYAARLRAEGLEVTAFAGVLAG